MKRDATQLTNWAVAAVDALSENGIPAIMFATGPQGAVVVQTTQGAVATVWPSGKVAAGGPQAARDEVLSVLECLVVGFRPGATGGMLLKMPEAAPLTLDEQVRAARETVDGARIALEERRRRADEVLARIDDRLVWIERNHEGQAMTEVVAGLRDLVALALGREVRR